MKQMKYLNAVLTVIAACLVMITLAITGLIPTASAKEPRANNSNEGNRGSAEMKVDIVAVNGLHFIEANEYRLPVYEAPAKR